ncbi:phosphotransferase [Phycicoccus avicenniae]|uniref:phosphotransferase n=1 Tax=Phycicoccus avicenniae TaxID=2828860 RepID=UPI003D2A16AD
MPHAVPDVVGEGAGELLALAAATTGARVLGHALHAVDARPGDGTTAGYRVRVEHPDGSTGEDYLLLSTSAARGVDPAAPGLVTLGSEAGRVLAWRFPGDPALPGLAPACDPVRAATLLPRGPLAGLALVGYRPLRRAVVRLDGEDGPRWVKVLRTGADARGGWADVRGRLEMLHAAGLPVPEVATEDEALGLLVLEHLPGRPLLDAVVADDARGVEVEHLVGLLDRLPAAVLDLPARPAWSDRARQYAGALAGTPLAARAAGVAEAVRRGSADTDLGPLVPTHGDLHEGQLTADPHHAGWRLRGLLDVDTVGPGHRVDDLACLLAHAEALGPAGAGVARRWRRDARRLADPAALEVRAAGVLLSLAVGAHDRERAGAAPGAGPDAGGLLALAEAALARCGAAQPSSR